MKKTIFVFILLSGLTVLKMNSQSLTFSTVLMIKDVEDTVPPGKVWKVEAWMQKNLSLASNTTVDCASSQLRPFMMNGVLYYKMGDVSTGCCSYIYGSNIEFPIWLPAGFRLKSLCPDDYLSVIEFTISP